MEKVETVPQQSLEVMPPGTPKSLSPDMSQHEPPMHVPRPSSDRAQDVSHILADLFQDLYTRDVMSKDTVKNLTGSSEGSSEFHKKCMNDLYNVHEEHKRKLEEYNMLERHIIQARARATSADEKALKHVAGDVGGKKYENLGLPPVTSHFRWCLAEEKLKQHGLIVPNDLFPKGRNLVEGPKRPRTPHFAMATVASSLHFSKEQPDDGFIDDKEAFSFQYQHLDDDDDKTITTLSSESADIRSIPPRHMVSHSETGLNVKNRWRDNMKQEARVKDREILARFEKRHNFLKNPRFLPLTEPKASRLLTKISSKESVLIAGRKVVRDCGSESDVQVFESNPPVVTFSDWTVGRVYESVLELRNISTVSRQLRVLPPKTPYFSIGLGKYPGAEGLVSPGISSQYNIRFMPDSLCDYEDEILVVSQSSIPMVVHVLARRQPPVLTLPEKIQCGCSLVGGVKVVDLHIKNIGGSGRFCALKRSMWPAANFKTVVNPGCLDIGTFQIRPSVFEILAGGSVTIELLFAPEETKTYKEELVVVCDNCQVKYFTIEGEGERAGVELVSVSDGGEESHRVGEIADLTANHFVRFPSLNPHSFYMRQVIVHNSTKVDLPFSWHILKPNLTSALDLISPSEINWENLDFYPDDSSPFFVEPMTGTLQPNGIHEFVLTFAPHQAGNYHNVLHLGLSDIPDSKTDSKHQLTVGGLPSGVGVVEKLNHSNRDEPTPKFSRSNSLAQQTSSASKVPSLRKVISLEIEICGESIPYSVVVHPPVIVIPGNVLVGETVRRPMRMANYSLAPAQFQWSSETNPNIVEVKPPMGLLNPGDIGDFEVTVTGLQSGPLTCNLSCKIEHQDEPLTLNVTANIQGATVVIDNVSMDFGLLCLGTSPTEKLFIRNITQLNAQWTLTAQDEDSSEMVIWPSSGELTALGQQEIKVTFKPNKCQSLNTCLNLDVVGGQGSSVSVKGEVQTPQACFRDCSLVLKEVFLSVPKIGVATLINQTSFPTAFSFDTFKGNKACEVSANPETGVLAPREERAIEVSFTCHVPGEVTDVYLPCHIEGMNDPIVLGFYANVGVLAVEFATPSYEGPDLKVVFGDPVHVGKAETSKIFLTNLTAIRSPWSASVDNFKAHKPFPKPPVQDFKSVKSRRAMLGRTPNLADPLAKTAAQAESEHTKLMLADGNGAAFVLEPSRGILEPYQSQEITLIAYNNMWGSYKDAVTFLIEGYPSQTIPVELNVSGCPLSFQVAHDRQKNITVRYGTHLEGSPSIPRKLWVNNASCYDIRLDWKTYNYPEPEDKKIVDLKIWFGEPFPLKETKGLDSIRSSMQQSSKFREQRIAGMRKVTKHETKKAETVKNQLHKLVNVRLEPRLGQLSNIPFSVEPDQIVVPAHGRVNISSVFQTVIGQCSDEMGKEYLSYALGFMSLDDDQIKERPDIVSRADGYSVEALRMELSGFVQAGTLRVETADDEDFTSFNLPLSDLLSPELALTVCCQEETCTLVNPTEANLSFSLSVKEPFYLVSNHPAVATSNLRGNHLAPQANMKVRIGYRMDETTLEDLKVIREGAHRDHVVLRNDDAFDSESLFYKGDLVITYCNGLTQEHHLSASVVCPSFKTCTDLVDFGVAFVGQKLERHLTIINRSGADTWWHASVTGNEDDNGEFCIEPHSGLLQAFVSHRAHNKATVTVSFVAKNEAASEATIVFKGNLNEPHRKVIVKGSGSFDGQYEHK